jgi:hypothetical protein
MLNRDLNVKLQGIKYNFGKVWGVKCRNPGLHQFSEFVELFFYRKTME